MLYYFFPGAQWIIAFLCSFFLRFRSEPFGDFPVKQFGRNGERRRSVATLYTVAARTVCGGERWRFLLPRPLPLYSSGISVFFLLIILQQYGDMNTSICWQSHMYFYEQILPINQHGIRNSAMTLLKLMLLQKSQQIRDSLSGLKSEREREKDSANPISASLYDDMLEICMQVSCFSHYVSITYYVLSIRFDVVFWNFHTKGDFDAFAKWLTKSYGSRTASEGTNL